jgi:hypothetical protein
VKTMGAFNCASGRSAWVAMSALVSLSFKLARLFVYIHIDRERDERH